MKILRMVGTIQGKTNDATMRSFNTHVRDSGAAGLFLEATNGGSNLSVGAMSSIAASILAPSTEGTSEIQIAHGFGERRIRFMMEVEVSTGCRQVLTGYTNYVGLTPNGAIDPSMVLYFNQSFMVQDRYMNSQTRGNYVDSSVTDASQYLVAPTLSSDAMYGVVPANNNVTLRPGDVIETFDLIDGAKAYGNQHALADELIIPNSKNIFDAGVRKSRITNGNSSIYLSSVVNSMAKAADAVDSYSYEFEGQNTTAAATVRESLIGQDSFFTHAALAGVNLQEGSQATWAELSLACPELPFVNNFAEMASKMAMMPIHDTRGQCQHLNGNTRETIASVTLINTLPSIMVQHALTTLEVTIQTCMQSTQNLTVNDINYGHGNGVVVVVSDARGLTKLTSDKLSEMIPILEHTISQTAALEVSHGGQVQLMAHCKIDLLGDSIVQIGFNGEPLTMFSNAQYASALSAPVLADNQQVAIRVAEDLNEICNLAAVTPESLNYGKIY